MRPSRHVGKIHGCVINKRTPTLLTSRTGSTRDRQNRHQSPIAAALSARVLALRRVYRAAATKKTTALPDKVKPASRYAARSARCRARCSVGQNKDRPFQGPCFCRPATNRTWLSRQISIFLNNVDTIKENTPAP
jgi:hypothetical protein